jgi:GntR family transcriptional regulator
MENNNNNLSKHSPLYITLANTLKEQILNNIYHVGDLLPTEDILQKEFTTSRTTVRSAVELLENEGYVKKFQGRGTEVCSRNPTQNLNFLSSISGTLSKCYGEVKTGSFTLTRTIPPHDIQAKFKIKENEPVYSLSRTKIVKGKIVAYIKNFLLPDDIPNLEEHVDYIKEHGLYQTLEQIYNLKLDCGIDNISVYMSGPLDSEIFEEHSSIPLYCTKRNTFLENGNLFEIVTAFIRAEDFEYTVYLKGRP